MTTPTIGFIGLGAMGAPMAGNLIRAGHQVSVHARRPAAMSPLVALGARACGSAAEAAAIAKARALAKVSDGHASRCRRGR